jgi:hypothetical protein
VNFTHYDLGYQPRGTVIELTLSGSAANVRLLDSSKNSYRTPFMGQPMDSIEGVSQILTAGTWYRRAAK